MEIITKDMYLAAILISYGSQIIEVDKTDLKKQYFHFDKLPGQVFLSNSSGMPEPANVSDLLEIKSHFLSKKLFFPPIFIDCLRSVKSYLYSE